MSASFTANQTIHMRSQYLRAKFDRYNSGMWTGVSLMEPEISFCLDGALYDDFDVALRAGLAPSFAGNDVHDFDVEEKDETANLVAGP